MGHGGGGLLLGVLALAVVGLIVYFVRRGTSGGGQIADNQPEPLPLQPNANDPFLPGTGPYVVREVGQKAAELAEEAARRARGQW